MTVRAWRSCSAQPAGRGPVEAAALADGAAGPADAPGLAATLGTAEADAPATGTLAAGGKVQPAWVVGVHAAIPAAMSPPPVSMAPRRKPLRVSGEVSGMGVGIRGSARGAEGSMRAS